MTRSDFEKEFAQIKFGYNHSHGSYYTYVASRVKYLSPEAIRFIADGNVPGEWLQRAALDIVFETDILGVKNDKPIQDQ